MTEGNSDARNGTWSELLRAARIMAPDGIDPSDAEYLLTHLLGCNRAGLYARLGDVCSPFEAGRFRELWQRRCAGEPYAYLIGSREFYGRDFQVDRRVLIPRPDTETLLEAGLARWPSERRGMVIDAGTGSGAIAVSFKLERPASTVLAVDASQPALALAQANARRLQADVHFWCGDWLQALQPTRVDLVLSNPPYLAAEDSHLPGLVASGEPESALLAPAAGLGDLLTLISGAREVLRPGGWLLMEHGWTQAGAVREALQAHGYVDVISERDLAGHERISGGRIP